MMDSVEATPQEPFFKRHMGLIFAIAILALIPLLYTYAPWAVTWPATLILRIQDWIGAFMDWLVKDLSFGYFTFQDITRSIAYVANLPLRVMNALLWEGIEINRDITVGPLSWFGIIGATVVFMQWLGGWRSALLATFCFGYMAVFGLWDSSMMTLSSILIAVPLGCLAGLFLGILAYRSKKRERAIIVLLDFMQTVPVFAYLLPVLFLFGFSPVSAMITTMIYAMPAMARATILGLRTVPQEVIEFGTVAGSTPRQMMWKVLLPSSAPTLVLGINQVVVLSLNAVIIASLIGAGGLGFDVLKSLRTLRIGQGLEAGIAIVLIAVLLDRIFYAWTQRPPLTHEAQERSKLKRYWPLILVLLILVISSVASIWLPFLRNYPQEWQISSGQFFNTVIDYINIQYYDAIESFSSFTYSYILNPIRDSLLFLPWSVVILLLALAGWRIQGVRLALVITALATVILITGFWEKSVITVYLIGVSVALSLLIGLPLGVFGALNDRASEVLRVMADILQTLPSFVYLIPVVMLFRVGDIPAIIAVVLYAVAPAIRYTDAGLRKVDPSLIEASRAMGANRFQLLMRVQFPLALPEILLGINQTILLAISMLVITALVGTRDLGQEVYVGLSRADTGLGLMAGICVAFIAIIADRLLQGIALKRKIALGID